MAQFTYQGRTYDTVENPGERQAEIPLAQAFVERVAPVLDAAGRRDRRLIEIGAVLPYWDVTGHAIVDPADPLATHPVPVQAYRSLVGRIVVSISTIEHMGTRDYGNTVLGENMAPGFLHRVLTEADDYFITWPVGYHARLDAVARNMGQPHGRPLFRHLQRRNGPTDWEEVDPAKGCAPERYGMPWVDAAGDLTDAYHANPESRPEHVYAWNAAFNDKWCGATVIAIASSVDF